MFKDKADYIKTIASVITALAALITAFVAGFGVYYAMQTVNTQKEIWAKQLEFDRPRIAFGIEQTPRFIINKFNNLSYLHYDYSNIGKRYAKNPIVSHIKMIVYKKVEGQESVVGHDTFKLYIGNDIQPGIYNRYDALKDDSLNYYSKLYLVIKFKYLDPLNDKEYSDLCYLSWGGIIYENNLDLEFKLMARVEREAVDKYIKESAIEF